MIGTAPRNQERAILHTGSGAARAVTKRRWRFRADLNGQLRCIVGVELHAEAQSLAGELRLHARNLKEASLGASRTFLFSLFQVVLPILTLCAEPTTHPVCLSMRWTRLIRGRGPLQQAVCSGSSDAGQTHCDPWSIHQGEACVVQHRLRSSVRSGQGCLAPEVVGALSVLALPMHVILVIGPSPL